MNILKPKPEAGRQAGDPWPLAEAAKRLGVSVRTLTRMEKNGTLRFIRGLGSRVLVPDAEVQRLRK